MSSEAGKKPFLTRLFTTSEGVSKIAMGGIGLLITLKVIGSIITGSIGIRADAIHSSIDFIGAFVGFIAIKLAGKPADAGRFPAFACSDHGPEFGDFGGGDGDL